MNRATALQAADDDAFMQAQAVLFVSHHGVNVAHGACRAVRSELLTDWLLDAVCESGRADVTTARRVAAGFLDGFRSEVRRVAEALADEAFDDDDATAAEEE